MSFIYRRLEFYLQNNDANWDNGLASLLACYPYISYNYNYYTMHSGFKHCYCFWEELMLSVATGHFLVWESPCVCWSKEVFKLSRQLYLAWVKTLSEHPQYKCPLWRQCCCFSDILHINIILSKTLDLSHYNVLLGGLRQRGWRGSLPLPRLHHCRLHQDSSQFWWRGWECGETKVLQIRISKQEQISNKNQSFL